MAGISDDIEQLRVNRNDFLNALDEVHPAFGVSEEELQQVIQNGIIHYDNIVDVSARLVVWILQSDHIILGSPARWPIICRTSPVIH